MGWQERKYGETYTDADVEARLMEEFTIGVS